MIRRTPSFLRLPPLLAGALVVLLAQASVDAQAPDAGGQKPPVQAANFDPSSVYFQGYLAIRDAEKLEAAGDFVGAEEKLQQARKIGDSISRYFPTWKPEMVKGRQDKTVESIARVQPKADEIRRKKSAAMAELEGGERMNGKFIDPARDARPLGSVNTPDPRDSQRLAVQEAQVHALEQKLRNTPDDVVQNARSQSQVRDLAAQRDQAQAELQRALADLNALRASLASAPVQSQVKDLDRKIDALEQEREAMSRALNQSSSRYADAVAKIKLLEADLNVAQQGKADLQRNLDKQTKVANDTVAGLMNQKKELEAKVKQKDSELAEATRNIISLTRQLTESQEANKQLAQEKESLIRERDQMSALLKLNEAGRIQQLIEQNMGLAKDLRESKERVDRLDAEGKKSQNDFEEALTDLAIAKSRINKLQQEKRDQDQRVADLEQRLRTEDSQLSSGTSDPNEVATLRGVIKKQLAIQKRQRDARDELIEAAKGSSDPTVKKAIELFDGQEIALTPEEQKVMADKPGDMIFVNPRPGDPKTAALNRAGLSRELESYDNAAKSAFEQGRYLPARELYEMSVKADPGDTGAINKLGFIQLKLEDLPAAIDTFRRAIEMDNTNPYACRMLGYSLLRLNDLSGAEQALRRALELAPDDAPSHLILGQVLFRQGRVAECESEYKSAITSNPILPEPYFNLAFLCSRDGRMTDAQRYYHEALERGALPDVGLAQKIGL